MRMQGGSPGTLTPAQGLYEQSATAKHRIGTRLQVGERVFYYGYFVAANAAGLIAAPDQSLVGEGLLPDGSLVALAAGTAFQDQPAITAALVAGQTWIAVTHASILDNITLNLLKDGYVVLTDSAGTDTIYKIKRNSVMASDVVAIELYDELVTSYADATTGISLMMNPYNQLRPAAVGTDESPAGVPLIDVTATYYAWVQTWGPGMVVTTTDTAFGGIDAELAGTGQVATRDTDGVEPRIGIGIVDVTTAGDGGLVKLQINP